MEEIMRILILFKHYQDKNGDGVEIETDPSKSVDVIKLLHDSTFLTVAVISNAIEIVAHNSKAAISIVNEYGDEELKAMLASYTDTMTPTDNGVNTTVLNELLRYMKDKPSD